VRRFNCGVRERSVRPVIDLPPPQKLGYAEVTRVKSKALIGGGLSRAVRRH
jgi:hypothetical protein